MKKRIMFVAALFFAVSVPFSAFAMMHEKGGHGHGDAKEKHGAHGSTAGHEKMIMVGDDTEDGVKASAHLQDVGEAMKKAGQKFTHHFMVVFVDKKSGKPITQGQAALKVTGPDGKTAEPMKLIGMEGHFGADIVLQGKGSYKYEVGTKLPDGKKRTFEFKQALK